MNHEEMYLISEDTYINHINEKVRLYSMVKQLSRMVSRLPANRGSKELSEMAATFTKRSEEMFKSWGIPGSYLLFGDEEDLYNLMESELFVPEENGYVLCDSEREECYPFDDGERCCDYAEQIEKGISNNADKESKNTEPDAGEFFGTLSEVMHTLFGDKVTVHIISE